MANFNPKTIIWICAIIGVVAIGAMIVSKNLRTPQSPGNQTSSVTELKSEKIEVPTSEFPENFPTDIPVERGAQTTQNYISKTNDGRFQSTRTFVSVRTLEQNLKIYQDYAQKNGWQIGSGVEQENLKVLTATKGNLTMTVTISQTAGSQTRTVNITITEFPQAE
jgi:hypothetical protein